MPTKTARSNTPPDPLLPVAYHLRAGGAVLRTLRVNLPRAAPDVPPFFRQRAAEEGDHLRRADRF